MKLNDEARLLLRLGHLRTLRCYTQDDHIVDVLKEFMADTEVQLASLTTHRSRSATLH
jgi:alpha-D-ribose 1-methylphosphonate 5-triphosphate diphosphatase PhnM